jgi:hypothetical protein
MEYKFMSAESGSARDHYLRYGLEPIDFDSDRAFHQVPGEPLTNAEREKLIPNSNIPPSIASALKLDSSPLPKGARHAEFIENSDYSHEADIARLAAKLHPIVAPTVTEDDMPAFVANASRKQLLNSLAQGGVDLDAVSLKALEHEATPEDHYWTRAFDECAPILGEHAHRLASVGCDTGAQNLKDASSMLLERLEDPYHPMGDTTETTIMFAALLVPEVEWRGNEKQTLLSHAIAQSRMGNRYARQFANAVDRLPPEAVEVADHVMAEGKEAQIMYKAKVMSALNKSDFLDTNNDIQMMAADLFKEVARHHDADHNSRKATGKAAAIIEKTREVARMPHSRSDIFEQHESVSKALMAEPLVGRPMQMRLLSNDIARLQVEDRSRSLDKVLGKNGGQER